MNKFQKKYIRPFRPTKVKVHRIKRGDLRGMKIMTSWRNYPGAILGRTEKTLLSWFKMNVKSGETWIDVGAHYDYTSMALSKLVGEEGRVFAFEPTLSTAGFLSITRYENNLDQLIIIPIGAGDSAGLAREKTFVSRGMTTHENVEGKPLDNFYSISLDSIWENISDGDSGVHGVKIDVDGMEIQAIRGMSSILKEFQPKLVVEIHHGVSRNDLLNLIKNLGYSEIGTTLDGPTKVRDANYLDNTSYAFTPKNHTQEN